ncbi:MAG TPA: hypothetical protein VHR17_00085 [Thermoanaerobaculia bacterium]|jgi:hypothetical protein|nr:hypothetical protein [Thermoanaerobaculia bacterium]
MARSRPETARVNLNKIINFVLLVVAVWFLWTSVIPWFRGLGSGPGSRSYVEAGKGEEGDCVMAARNAAEVFAEEMRSFSKPPIDLDAWDRTYLRIENRIAAADDECDCSRPACYTAQGALGSLRELGDDFSAAARGDGTPPINGASTINQVYDTLDHAAQQSSTLLE